MGKFIQIKDKKLREEFIKKYPNLSNNISEDINKNTTIIFVEDIIINNAFVDNIGVLVIPKKFIDLFMKMFIDFLDSSNVKKSMSKFIKNLSGELNGK